MSYILYGFVLVITHTLITTLVVVALLQWLNNEMVWWRKKFKIGCFPREDSLFWLAQARKGYSWERLEMGAALFTFWQLPWALTMALRLGARWKEIWIKWL